MEKRPRILQFVFLTVAAVGILSVILSRGQQPRGVPHVPPLAKADTSQETTVGSPDGKFGLTMKEVKGKEDVTYIFSILNSNSGSQKEIFRKTVPVGFSMSIPANTFSPDDKYVFLKGAGSEVSYLVLSASGTPLTKDGSILEISSLYSAKYSDYKITDVTGWGGVGLIVFNTDKVSGGTGPSFWFEVSSHSFIQLGTRFN